MRHHALTIPGRYSILLGCLVTIGIIWSLAAKPCAARGKKIRETPRITAVRVGFRNLYKLGYWTPLEVVIQGGSKDFTGIVQLETADGDGETYRVMSETRLEEPGKAVTPRAYQFRAGQETVVPLLIKFGRFNAKLTVRIIADSGVIAKRKFESGPSQDGQAYFPPLETRRRLIVNIGPSSGLSDTQEDQTGTPVVMGRERSHRVANIHQTSHLPLRWYGYEGVNAVVLTTSDISLIRSLQNNRRIEALKQWVRMGGYLVLSVGSNADEVLRKDSPLIDFVPGKFERSILLPPGNTLESYVEAGTALDWSVSRPSVALLKDVRGKIEAHAGRNPTDLPLVIRSSMGLGTVIFVAFDLDQKQLLDWADDEKLLRKLLNEQPVEETESSGNSAYMTPETGYDDLSGQLRSGLDQFTGVRPIAFSWVALLVVAYILCIGPLDYFLVRKVFHRSELTWITFTSIVIGFSLLAYFMAIWLKGDKLRLNQVDLVDVDVVSKSVRGTSWINLFSPTARSYNLQFTATFPDGRGESDSQVLLSWLGLPGTALGGMRSPATPTLFSRAYSISPAGGSMSQVPIQVWSTKGFYARWQTETNSNVQQMSDLKKGASTVFRGIEGTIRNPLSIPLKSCRLFFDKSVYNLGDLPANGEIQVDRNLETVTLSTFLTGRVMLHDSDVSKPYDEYGQDVDDILQKMMFYEAAEGKAYTKLDNYHHSFIDLSQRLQFNEAILLALGDNDEQICELTDDGQSLHTPGNHRWTIYRFILPVEIE